MRIAITSTGNTLKSILDKHFGRCAWFVIYDTGTGSIEFVPNPHKGISGEAGVASAKFVAEKNIDKVVSGEYGDKAKDMLDQRKIQLILFRNTTKTIEEILKYTGYKA